MRMGPGGVYGRLALTLIVAIGALLLARITVPGVDGKQFDQLAALGGQPTFEPSLVGIFALELNPLLSAVFWVEVLALIIPRWRGWRLGGYPERERLWKRVKIIGLVLVLLQAFFLVRWMRGNSAHYPMFPGLVAGARNDPFLIALQTLSLAGGTFLLFWFTRLIDAYGAGNGFSVMITAFLVTPTAGMLVWSVRQRLRTGDFVLLPICIVAVVVVAVTWLAGGRSLRPRAAPPGGEKLPIPSSGLHPIVASVSLLSIPASFAAFGIDLLPPALQSESWPRRAVQAALIAGFCLLDAWLFNRPRRVAEAWRRAGAPAADEAQLRDRVRAAFARALAWALVVCWALAGADWLVADAQLIVSTANLTVIACVVVDVAGEVMFRSRHGALAQVWPVHRLYVVPGMLKALEAAGIPAYPRGRRHRTLWSFFAPYVPVDILVPVELAQRAEEILLPLAAVR